MNAPKFPELVPEATDWPLRRVTGKQPVAPLRRAVRDLTARSESTGAADIVATYEEEIRGQLMLRAVEAVEDSEQRRTYLKIIDLRDGVASLRDHAPVLYAIGECRVVLEEANFTDHDFESWVRGKEQWPVPQFGLPDRLAGRLVHLLQAAAEHTGLEAQPLPELRARFDSAVAVYQRAATHDLGLQRGL